MKLSVSLPDDDVAALDEFARANGLASRSAALQHAVKLLRLPHLEEDYEAAWRDWESAGDHDAWDSTTADGIIDAAR